MIEIIEPEQFKTIPWKNGQGETTELAINENGCLDDFDWRLSIASVVKDGVFSNFNGYSRNLVLIEGEGLSLTYDNTNTNTNTNTETLTALLDVARFSGGCQTYGELTGGAIKDFNVITHDEKVSAVVNCYLEAEQVKVSLSLTCICFAYSLTDEIVVETVEHEKTSVPVGYLVKLSKQHNELKDKPLTLGLTGKNMIIMQLDMIAQ